MRTSTGSVLLATVLALTGCAVSIDGPAAPAVGRADTAQVGVPVSADAPPPSPPSRLTVDPEPPAPAAEVEAAAEAPVGPAADPSPAPVAPVVDPSAAPVEASPAPTTEPVAPSPEPEPDDGQLRQGDSGPEVLAVQQRLAELGYWAGSADGSFGSLTTQAVLAVQKAAGISRDGVVGPRTLAALEAGSRPSARRGGDGVEIDLERQLLLVVRGGEVRTVLNTSTGVPGRYDTPRGEFRVQRAIDGLRVAPLGELWRPRYFNGGIAVHGSPNIPAHPASHGCARLSNAAINMVWAEDLMPLGSSVAVY